MLHATIQSQLVVTLLIGKCEQHGGKGEKSKIQSLNLTWFLLQADCEVPDTDILSPAMVDIMTGRRMVSCRAGVCSLLITDNQ